jgi:hypothetical protein
MPFIVTTKDTTAVARGIGHQARFTKIVERWAVATLEEVKALVGPEATRAAAAMSIPEPDGTTTFPGGTITLSDGRTIEVVAVDDAEYARAIDAGMNGPAVPGVAEPDPAPIRGRWMIRVCQHGHRVEYRENYGGWLHMDAGDTAVCDSADVARVVPVPDEAAIIRAADAIGSLGTDQIGAEPYAAARAILRAALEPPA